MLAKKYNAAIYALHMLDIQEVSLTESEFYQQEKAVFFLKLAEKKFKNFLKKSYLKDVDVIPVIKHYKVFSEINAIAKENIVPLTTCNVFIVSGIKVISDV